MENVIDEEVNIPISFTTKIIKGVAITRVGFASASLFPGFFVPRFTRFLGFWVMGGAKSWKCTLKLPPP